MLENAQVVYWIDSGTLLGVYRAQQLVPWDYNVDIGVTAAGLDYLRSKDTEPLEVTEGYELTVFNSSLHEAGETSTAVPVRFVDTTLGFYANVFAFEESQGVFKDDVKSVTAADMEENVVGNGFLVETLVGPEPSEIWHRCVHCPMIQDVDDSITSKDFDVNTVTKQFRVPRDWLFPLRTCRVELFEVKCPAQTAPYLMYIFGNRFLTPELWD
uniref:LicD/FKTN/FKRP nucleotidyltransferase domain-containing protein n=1 Tax=Hyaloperonospora arabidopsidis (strain Emoy2) TaxID=559515 RepID=M4BBK5_HYAAE